MAVKRIVVNTATEDMERVQLFYQDILGLEILMDMGWIRTYGNDNCMQIQMSFYGPVNEPWGVRRFFVKDPYGKLVNILQHLVK